MNKELLETLKLLYLQICDVSELSLDLAQDLGFIYKMEENAREPEVNFVKERHPKLAYKITNLATDVAGKLSGILQKNGIDTWHLICSHSKGSISIIGDGIQTIHLNKEEK